MGGVRTSLATTEATYTVRKPDTEQKQKHTLSLNFALHKHGAHSTNSGDLLYALLYEPYMY